MKIAKFADKKVLIIGRGIEGKATLEFLRYHLPDIIINVVDQEDGEGYLDNQDNYDIAIKSPSVKKELITIPYTTATNIFFANTKGMVIGVTGTKGKSTTACLLFEILKAGGKQAHLVGNIGNPMLSELLKEKGQEDIYVCELSSYQLQDIQYSPHIAVFVSFFPEHMDHHGSVDAYWQAKKNIVFFSTKEDYFIFNPAFDLLRVLATQTIARSVPYVDSIPIDEKEVPLLGGHNRDNIRAAVTVAAILHISPNIMRETIGSFRSLPHRLEYVGTFKDISFYDDAISTTPESTICAIDALEHVNTIFLGGQDRGYVFDELVRIIDTSTITNIVLFPDSGSRIKEKLTELSQKPYMIFETKDMKDAVQFAFEKTAPGTICLLSTASPSYSVWKNFEEKGALFSQYAKEIGKKI